MDNNWRKIFVKPEVEGRSPQRLDEHLMGVLPVAVTQHFEDGRYSYKPNAEGLYEVRVLEDNDLTASITRGIIRHEGFSLVREEVLNGSKVIEAIDHRPEGSTDFSGRRK